MIERAPTVGKCIVGWHGHVALIDPHASVASGDLCRVIIDYSDGRVASVVKFIECDSQGRWWISCDDGALLIGTFITPRVVQRVVGREPSLINLDHVPVRQPSAHTLEVGRRRLEELRADQVAHGRRIGVPFPAEELTHPKPFGRVPETMHATLPESDLPLPGAPQNFSITLVGNIAMASWDEAEPFPPRSKYQLWAAASSLSDVGSKVLYWEGDALSKTLLFSANSPYWFQCRAQCGSAQTSAFQPSTYGLGLAPTLAQVYSSATWGFAVSPAGVSKIANLGSLTTPPMSAIITNSAGSAVFSWYNPNSIDIRINSPGGASTTFTGSSMNISEYRGGAFWVNVNDSGNVSSKSFSVSVERDNGL
jgi:hypothetical protein